MKWVAVLLVVLLMVMACDNGITNDTATGADNPDLEARMAALEKRVETIEKELSGFYGTIPGWEMNSRLDKLDERISSILRSLRDPRYPLPY